MKYPIGTKFGKFRHILNNGNMIYDEHVEVIGYFEENNEKCYWLRTIPINPSIHHSYFFSPKESDINWYLKSHYFWPL